MPPAPWRVFGSRSFFRLWVAQVSSSLGDWVGLFAILAITARVSNNSAAALSLVMVARMLPGFFLATVGGLIVDRFDRRKVMVTCDIMRAGLFILLPFVSSLLGLVIISFLTEIGTLLWGPAKDASVPHLVGKDQLASANSLSLAASYGTFPLGGVAFSALAVIASWLGHIPALSALKVDREFLALWMDALSYVASALIVMRLPIPRPEPRASHNGKRIDWTQTLHEIVDGLKFMRQNRLVRAVIAGMGGALIGAGAMIPLGPVFAREILGSSAQFGLLMMALGFGACGGVVSLLALQKRLPQLRVFEWGIIGVGVFLMVASSMAVAGLAALATVMLGACGGAAYVTGFTVLQESVSDDMRGRTFATLYTVIRLCLLLSLTVAPLFADLYQWLSGLVLSHHTLTIVGLHYRLPGVRWALWSGGLVVLASGVYARISLRGGEVEVDGTSAPKA